MTKVHYFGIWLTEQRRQRNLTQAALSELIDRSVDAISNIERGKSLPSYELIADISRVFKVDPHVMFEDGQSEVSPERKKLLVQLTALTQCLSDADLEIAVAQVEVLANRGS